MSDYQSSLVLLIAYHFTLLTASSVRLAENESMFIFEHIDLKVELEVHVVTGNVLTYMQHHIEQMPLEDPDLPIIDLV